MQSHITTFITIYALGINWLGCCNLVCTHLYFVSQGLKSRLQLETFHIGINFLSSYTLTLLPSFGDPI
jgi:hypothetical protein